MPKGSAHTPLGPRFICIVGLFFIFSNIFDIIEKQTYFNLELGTLFTHFSKLANV